MSWRRLKPHFIRNPVIGLNQGVQTGLQDRLNGLLKHSPDPILLRLAPMFPLSPSKQIARMGKGGHLLPGDQHGVPTYMVHVKVSAENNVN